MTQETFERELARRADDVHGAPFTLADVRGRARSIQRRRRAAVAGAVAAVVALVLVVPAALSGGPAKGSRGVEPAPPRPHHAAVLHDGTVTRPDGSTVAVPVDNANVGELGVLTDGRIVLAMEKPHTVRVYESDGRSHTDYPVAANAITMSARDDAVAWVADDFTVRVLASGAAEPAILPGIPMPGEAAGSIDAVLDAEHLLVGDHTTTTGELTPDGVTDLPAAGEQFRVEDVSPDGSLMAVTFLPDADQQYGCGGLVDASGAVVQRSCEVHPIAFAPDGAHLLSAYFENNMAGAVTVVGLDLRPVATFEPDGNQSVSRVAWDDSEHLMASVAGLDDNSWSLVRASLDGSGPEVVTGPEDGGNPEQVAAFVLAE